MQTIFLNVVHILKNLQTRTKALIKLVVQEAAQTYYNNSMSRQFLIARSAATLDVSSPLHGLEICLILL